MFPSPNLRVYQVKKNYLVKKKTFCEWDYFFPPKILAFPSPFPDSILQNAPLKKQGEGNPACDWRRESKERVDSYLLPLLIPHRLVSAPPPWKAAFRGEALGPSSAAKCGRRSEVPLLRRLSDGCATHLLDVGAARHQNPAAKKHLPRWARGKKKSKKSPGLVGKECALFLIGVRIC